MKKYLLPILTFLLLFTGCTPKTATITPEEKQAILTTLQQSQEIQVVKKGVASMLNNNYEILVNDEVILEVSGKYINLTGDVFTMKTPDGKIIATEKQQKRWGIKFNRKAQVFNELENKDGYIGEEVFNDLFNIGYKFHFYDKADNETGYTQQQIFSLTLNSKVYNANGALAYKIDGQLFNFVDTKYKITIVDSQSPVDIIQVLFFTCIINEIAAHEE